MNFLDFVISDLYKNIHQLGKNGRSESNYNRSEGENGRTESENGLSESDYNRSESENGIFKGDLSNVIVVLPTRRAGAFLKQALGSIAHAQNGTDRDKPICAPQVTTINDLIDSLCPYRKADEIEVVCLLYTVYKHFIPNHSLYIDAFYGWGRQLIADFNNVDKSYDIISKENILEFAKDARKFDQVNIDPEVKARICQLLHMTSDTNAPQKAEKQANRAGTEGKDAKTERNSAETDTNRAETDIDEHSVREELEALWRKLPEIYDSLAKKLEERGAMLEGARNKWVVTHIEEVKKQLEGRFLVFAGFNFLLRTELTLMRQLKDAGMARFYWDYDPDFSQKEHNLSLKDHKFSQKGQDFSQEEQGGSQQGRDFSLKEQDFSLKEQESFPVYQHIKKNLEVLGGKYEQNTTLSGDNWPKKEVDLYSAQSDNAQAHLITDWLANHYAQGQTSHAQDESSHAQEQISHAQRQTSPAQEQASRAQSQTSPAQGQTSPAQEQISRAQGQTSPAQRQTCAVVLCNEQMLESAIFSVPPELSGEVNITKGFPMRNTPVFSQISKQLSTAAKRAVSTAKQLGTATKHAVTAAKRAATPADMIQGTLDLINSEREELREKGFPEIAEDADEFTWHQLLQAESLYQALQVVNSFARLLDEGLLPDNITLPMLRNLILRHLGSVSIPFHGEPITDIQIIGVLETRALDFDNILLLNVEEGTLPRTSIDRSFIPYYIRKYYGMPTSDEDTEIYAYNFFRLLRRAKHISIAYSEAQSAEGQKQMSRFVLQMLTSPLFDCHRYLLSDNNALPQPQSEQTIHDKLLKQSNFHSYAEKLANTATDAASSASQSQATAANATSSSSQSQATAADAASPSSQTPPSLSPSAINTFLTCKMKFFIRYMLGINEPDSEDALLQANELGSLIHGALQAIYNAIKSPENGEVSRAAIENVIKGKATAISLDAAIDISIAKMNTDYQKYHTNTASGTKYSRESHQIEVEVAKTHVKKVLENDKKNGGFRLIDTERDTYLTIDVSNLGISAPNLKTLRIGGSIDRLDVVYEPKDAATGSKDAVLRVIDYKTGSYDKKKMRTDSIDDLFDPQKTQHYVLQTFIYCLACLRDTSTSGQSPNISAQIAKENWKVSPRLLFTQKDLSQFDPHIYIKDKPVTDFENQEIPIQDQTPDVKEPICAEFEAKLTEFVKNLLSEKEFPMTTDVSSKSPCAYCPYKLLCGRTNVSGW